MSDIINWGPASEYTEAAGGTDYCSRCNRAVGGRGPLLPGWLPFWESHVYTVVKRLCESCADEVLWNSGEATMGGASSGLTGRVLAVVTREEHLNSIASECQRLGIDLGVMARLLAADNGKHHVKLGHDGWTIQHPISERLKGTLLNCDVTWTGGEVGVYGTFVMEWDDLQDDWVLGECVE